MVGTLELASQLQTPKIAITKTQIQHLDQHMTILVTHKVMFGLNALSNLAIKLNVIQLKKDA